MLIETGTTEAAMSAPALSGVLIALGAFLTKFTPIKRDWIPLILLVLGTGAYLGLSDTITVETIILGVGAALSAVGIHSGTRATANAIKPNP